MASNPLMSTMPTTRRLLLLILTPLLALASTARAQVTFTATPASEEVRVEVIPQTLTPAPGQLVPIAIVFNHADSWHIHTSAPKPPPGVEEGVLIPTEITPAAIPSLAFAPVQWPATKTIAFDLLGTGKPSPYDVYAGRAIAYLPVRIGPEAKPSSTITLPIEISYQACNDTMCLPPDGATATVTFTIAATSPKLTTSPEFANFDPTKATTTVVPPTPRDAGAEAQRISGSPPSSSFFGLSLGTLTGGSGLLILSALGALGGFILNLTPCVLPVIPIKIMTLTQGAADSRKSIILGLWMSLGVFAFWLALGVVAVSATAWADPSRVFGIWWVTAGIGAIIGVMALGIMGLFTFNLPQSVYAINPSAKSPGGSFLFGVMTAVLGLPCFGFVAGALLPAAAAIGPSATIAVFASMGVGMALPYAILTAKPSLIAKVPRTGPASELVKQVMGLLLLAAAAFFLGSGLLALVQDKPYLGKVLHWWAVALLGTLAGGWLAVRTIQITKSLPRQAFFSIVGLLIAAVGIYAAWSFTDREARDHAIADEARAKAANTSELVPGIWNKYNQPAIDRALASGKIVVMDYTAEWCLNCKALKAAVLDVDPVRSALQGNNILKVEVDLTSTRAPGWAKLRSLGQTGIPLLTVQGPGLPKPWLSNAYTSGDVLDALARAQPRPPTP